MNTGTGIVPTMPIGNNGFGDNASEWIFGLIFLAAFTNGGLWGGNGGNNVATADQVAIQGLQNNLFDVNNNINSGLNRVSDGIMGTMQAVYNTGASVASQVQDSKYNTAIQILDTKYANQLGQAGISKDILVQTNQLQNQAGVNALEAQAHLDSCCCDLKELIRQDGETTRALITQNTIQDLRDRNTSQANELSDLRNREAIVNAIIPRTRPAYLTSSPYQSIYNPYNYGYTNGYFGASY